MNSATLMRLLGGEAKAGTVLEGGSLRFGEEWWRLGLALLLVASVALAWWAYRRSPMDLTLRRRLFLAGLRATFFFVLGLILLQPLLVLTMVRTVPRTLLVGIDRSESFGLVDLKQEATRAEIARRLLTQSESNLISRLSENLKVAAYSFGAEATALELEPGGLAPFQPNAPATALGDAVMAMLARHAGEPLAGLVLLTDGNNNRGPSLEAVVQHLQSRDVPLHVIGIGATSTIDATLERIEAPNTALAGDVLPVRIVVRSEGLEDEPAEVVLRMSGEEVARQAFSFAPEGSREVDVEFLPARTGSFVLEAAVETGREELVEANNVASEPLRVVDATIRVLMLEQAPRWEFKYLQAMLLREDRVELKCLLLEGDPAAARIADSPYLERFPQPEELLAYDLVFLGDVEPSRLSDRDWSSLKEFVVETGGSLVVIAGKRFTPAAYRHRALEPMLPVALPPATLSPAPATQPWQLHPAGGHPMLVLADDAAGHEQAWRELPPVFWLADIAGVKPAAEVLLVASPDGANSADERSVPVAVVQRYGAGEVLFMGTDNTWRWRRNSGDRIYTRFWGQMVQRLAGQRLVQGSRRTSISTDRRRYTPGERVTINAMLRSSAWVPLTQETVPALLETENGEARPLQLQAVPGQPGAYRAETVAGSSGAYRLRLPGDSEVLPAEFQVRPENRELDAVTVDAKRLRRVAESTGGSFFLGEEAAALPERIVHRSAQIRRPRELPFWASPLYFILLLLPLTAEWIVRKLSELK